MGLRARVELPIRGFDCPATGRVIERELALTPGVLKGYVNAATEIAYIEYDTAVTDPARIAQAIERAGYASGPVNS